MSHGSPFNLIQSKLIQLHLFEFQMLRYVLGSREGAEFLVFNELPQASLDLPIE